MAVPGMDRSMKARPMVAACLFAHCPRMARCALCECAIACTHIHHFARDSIPAEVEARLYKLLLYERGSHFKPHRDSPKGGPGMFGTLTLMLPSENEVRVMTMLR